MSANSEYQDIVYTVDGAVATLTINRPENGNKFRRQTALELADALRRLRQDDDVRVVILTGAGDKFFCIGGEHDPLTSVGYGTVLPIIDVYQLIDSIPKPIIAAVNGFAVGGGHVLHNMCDLSIAAEHAVFRQVGPLVGSFDAGYGTWYLEDTIGRKRAKEMWLLNRKYSAEQAERMGLVNEVVPGDRLLERVREIADEIAARSPLAVGALKAAFSARHNGVAGQARMAHDQQLTLYLMSEEAKETAAAFAERRRPDSSHFLK
ncbi:enoyl-CoA hydratase-related protein [Jatrophihabitans cynanchi]|uniref:Enoyl-CoA hydratase-related protein n=1 Tax=Jatrophihabitans cynanchi TaxID=2944128 RepID=A0ABY7K0K9_9ACTN|nr:enoyl-CoA hydratase-related protein [Jatrophihabitans sp. SB3-54]WAX58388.1 enoyl-CoA hydratase-related protein [Jatrophihabitans sp. SB3-54]